MKCDGSPMQKSRRQYRIDYGLDVAYFTKGLLDGDRHPSRAVTAKTIRDTIEELICS